MILTQLIGKRIQSFKYFFSHNSCKEFRTSISKFVENVTANN